MAKRTVVGTILKSKTDGDLDYIKLSGYTKDKLIAALSKTSSTGGLTLQLENAQSLRKKAEYLLTNEKISSVAAEGMKERADKIPSFVRFELVLRSDEE